jgi:hypothetical protein
MVEKRFAATMTGGLLTAGCAAVVFGINNSWFAFRANSAGVSSEKLVAAGALLVCAYAFIMGEFRLSKLLPKDWVLIGSFSFATALITLTYLKSLDTTWGYAVSSSVAVVILYTYPLIILLAMWVLGQLASQSLLRLTLIFSAAFVGLGLSFISCPDGSFESCHTFFALGMAFAFAASCGSVAQIMVGKRAEHLPLRTLAFWSQLFNWYVPQG